MEEMNRQMQGFVDYVREEMLARMQQQQNPGAGLVPLKRVPLVPVKAARKKAREEQRAKREEAVR
jgi:MerR family transcriptional regulator/heat shock protein HspR